MIKTKLSFIISIAACALATVMLVTACLAWFAFNSESDVSGVDFITSTSTITFGDEIISRRRLEGRELIETQYTKDSDGAYYTMVNGEKEFFSMTGILPGESIDITASLDAKMLTNDFVLEFGLGNVSGDKFVYHEKTYNVLGVFCVYPFIYDETRVDESVDKDGFILATDERKWLCEYNDSNADTDLTSVSVKSDRWANLCLNEDGSSATIKFRLELNLEQYREQDIQQQNLLSQKNISIGSVYALVML